jgi:hypothetical protein
MPTRRWGGCSLSSTTSNGTAPWDARQVSGNGRSGRSAPPALAHRTHLNRARSEAREKSVAAIVWAIAGVLADTARAVSAKHAPEEAGWTVATLGRRAVGRYHLDALDPCQALAAVGADDLPLVLLAFPTAGLVETSVLEAKPLLFSCAAFGAVTLRTAQVRTLPIRLALGHGADVAAGLGARRVGAAIDRLPGRALGAHRDAGDRSGVGHSTCLCGNARKALVRTTVQDRALGGFWGLLALQS